MTKDGFAQAASKAHDLGAEGRAEIDAALDRYLVMSKQDRAALIEDIEQTGTFRVFGYGSLMGDPHADPDEEYEGHLPGWQRGVYCKDRHYRGKPDELGVTMGAEPVEGGDLRGVVKVEKAEASSADFKDRVLRSIHAFALRETSANPIYAYKVVDVETEGHGTVKALICAADPENPLYLGDDPAPIIEGDKVVDAEGLSVEEKAAMIASCKGVDGASARNTGLDYWQFILHCTYEAGQEPEPHILEMVQLANAHRALLPEDERLELEAIESRNSDRQNYDPRAFATADAREIIGYDPEYQDHDRSELALIHARNAIGDEDPLSAEELRIIERNKGELEEILAVEPS